MKKIYVITIETVKRYDKTQNYEALNFHPWTVDTYDFTLRQFE